MAKRRAARPTRRASRATKGVTGMHPVFGPVADPGPDDLHGGWGGVGGWSGGLGGWHGGPVADPGPIFGGWRGSLVGPLDRAALDASALKQLAGLRVRRVRMAVQALEEQLAIAEDEFKLLSRLGDSLRIDTSLAGKFGGHGDPPPELRPVDFLRYLHDLRVGALRRTIDYLQAAAKAIESAQ